MITVEGPKIKDIEQKRQLVKKLYNSAVEIYGIDKEHIIMLIRETAHEHSHENVGVGGQLIADRSRK